MTKGSKGRRLAVRACVALLFAAAVALIGVLYNANRTLGMLIGRMHFGALSVEQRKMLLGDLQSGDSIRVGKWERYFRHTVELEEMFPSGDVQLDDLAELYRKREQPARSNYFGDLLLALSIKQLDTGLDKNTLVGYLGAADSSYTNAQGAFWIYKYDEYGAPARAFVRLTNDAVLEIMVDPSR